MNPNEAKTQGQSTKSAEGGKAPKCINCGTESKERLLISCYYKEDNVHVCARCLPMFIHGAAE